MQGSVLQSRQGLGSQGFWISKLGKRIVSHVWRPPYIHKLWRVILPMVGRRSNPVAVLDRILITRSIMLLQLPYLGDAYRVRGQHPACAASTKGGPF